MFDYSIYQDKNHLRLLVGQLSSQVCDKLASIGMIWILLELLGEWAIPWYLLAGTLPHLLLIGVVSKWQQRLSPLRIVIFTDYLRGVLFLVAAACFYFFSTKNLLFFLIINFLHNSLGAFFNSAILALPVQVTQKSKYEKLSSLINSCFSLGNVLGPFLVAILYPVWGLAGLLFLNGVVFVLSAIVEMGIKVSRQITSSTVVAKNCRVVMGNYPVIKKLLIIYALMNFFLAPIFIILPVYAKTIYHAGVELFSLWEMLFGLGALLTSLFLSLAKINIRPQLKLFYSVFLLGLVYLILAASKLLWMTSISIFIVGVTATITNITSLFLFQSIPEEEDLSAVTAMVNAIVVTAMPLAMLMISYFSQHYSYRQISLVAATIMIFLPFLLLSSHFKEIGRKII